MWQRRVVMADNFESGTTEEPEGFEDTTNERVVIQLLDERSPISRKTIPVILRNSKRKSTSTLEDEDVVPKKYEPIDKDFYGRPLVEIDPFIYDEVCTLRDVNVLGPFIELVLKLTNLCDYNYSHPFFLPLRHDISSSVHLATCLFLLFSVSITIHANLTSIRNWHRLPAFVLFPLLFAICQVFHYSFADINFSI